MRGSLRQRLSRWDMARARQSPAGKQTRASTADRPSDSVPAGESPAHRACRLGIPRLAQRFRAGMAQGKQSRGGTWTRAGTQGTALPTQGPFPCSTCLPGTAWAPRCQARRRSRADTAKLEWSATWGRSTRRGRGRRIWACPAHRRVRQWSRGRRRRKAWEADPARLKAAGIRTHRSPAARARGPSGRAVRLAPGRSQSSSPSCHPCHPCPMCLPAACTPRTCPSWPTCRIGSVPPVAGSPCPMTRSA